MSISTRKGDDGQTELMFGRRVPKDHPRVAASGAVDELNAALGLVRVACPEDKELSGFIAAVQEDLVVLMGEMATLQEDRGRYAEKGFQKFDSDRLEKLDDCVEAIEAMGLTFKGWAMPGAGGDGHAAQLDFARTVCRRAECAAISVGSAEIGNEIQRYLNRLSDALWLRARQREAGSTGS